MRLVLIGSSMCGTTITRRILSAHNRIWLTNELRTYYKINKQSGIEYSILSSKEPKDYFKSLLDKIYRGEGKAYHALPPWVNYDEFVSNCMLNLKEDTVIGRVSAVENVLFESKFEYYGDNGADIEVLKTLPDTKVIFIYRDGRDAAVFGARFNRGMEPPWSNSIVDNADYWAENMEIITKNFHNFKDFISIRFEDYIENPIWNFDKMSSFLNVNLYGYRHLIKQDKARIGCYEKGWMDWRKDATDKTKKMLKLLGYI